MGKHLAQFEQDLIKHVGGRPSAPQMVLIQQAVDLEEQIYLLQRKGIETDHDRRCFAAWMNARRLTMREIGVQPKAEQPPSLQEYLAQRAAEKAASEREAATA